MQTEIEAKFLNVNHDKLRAKLKELGAECAQPMQVLTRVNMDFKDKSLSEKGGWVRVRGDGKKATLAYKELGSWTLHGVKEIEVNVSDFADTQKLLEAIGLEVYAYQVTKRETWEYKGAEIVLDIWPWVKPFIEIEGPSEENVREVAGELGFEWDKDAVFGSVEPVYLADFDITNEQFYTLDKMTFDDRPPEWLEKKRRG
ncbi:MAG TPA: class IV adenylate cyclase [Candidatus Limnocylindria bacterium]|nr:class IV adenylate cyclase [Candidatus Limnocylindria bacterium]